MNVLWFSAGVSSAICAYLCKDRLDKIIYMHINDQHPDTLRFVSDISHLISRPIEQMQHDIYKSVEDVCLAYSFVASAQVAKCTEKLKKELRKRWEYENPSDSPHVYFWGLDRDELSRADNIVDSMPDSRHVFPLIENNLTKQDAHALLERLGIRRPAMYDLGYHNNNCIGCVKGGKGYWNKIRLDFPEVFQRRAIMERKIGHTCLRQELPHIKGQPRKSIPLYLDELMPDAGRHDPPITTECGVACQIMDLDKNGD